MLGRRDGRIPSPFVCLRREPFVVELIDGTSHIVPHPPAFDENGAGFIDTSGALSDSWFKDVRSVRLVSAAQVS